MVCVKCGRELEQTRCGSCGYEHREGIRLLGIPEESALILSWDNFSAQRLKAAILQREAELLRLRTLLH